MNNNNFLDKRELKFNSFLTKTIILSSKKYYKEDITKNFNELKIIDDENYSEYIKKYISYENEIDTYTVSNIDTFVNQCENSMLIHALKSLSNIEMTVIFLLFEKHMSSKDASKILEICSDSVTRIKRRALKKLKDYLEGR